MKAKMKTSRTSCSSSSSSSFYVGSDSSPYQRQQQRRPDKPKTKKAKTDENYSDKCQNADAGSLKPADEAPFIEESPGTDGQGGSKLTCGTRVHGIAFSTRKKNKMEAFDNHFQCKMQEVFQLIVSSFEDLVDKSSPSYAKRTSILENVAKVRSCVVMLHLECDVLIIEMFQHFLKAIRKP